MNAKFLSCAVLLLAAAVGWAQNAADLYRQAYQELTGDLASLDGQLDGLEAGEIDAAARQFLDSQAPALDLFRQATRAPECDWKRNYSKGITLELPELTPARALSRVALLNARRLLADGDLVGATDGLSAVFVQARHHGSEPILICYLVAAAIEQRGGEVAAAMASRLGRDQVRVLRDRLIAMPAGPSATEALRGDFKLCLAWLENLSQGDADAAVDEGQPLHTLLNGNNRFDAFADAWRSADRRTASLKTMRRLGESLATALELPNEQKLIAVMREDDAATAKDPIVAAFVPSVVHIRQAAQRNRVARTMLIAGLSVVVEGKAALDDPRYADPSTGKPFGYEPVGPAAEGFVLVSLGDWTDRDGHPARLRFAEGAR